MSERLTHEEYVQSCRKRATALAQGMIEGSISLLDGCHELASLRANIEVPEDDPDFRAFLIVSSECDALPADKIRALWTPEALAKLEPEIKAAIEWAAPIVLPACRSVVQRFNR